MHDNYTADQIVEFMRAHWPELHSPVGDFLIYLNRIRDLVHAQVREILTTFSLSTGEFDILATLRRTAMPYVLTPTELQRSVLITSGGLTKLLYQLEARGLVSRSVQAQDKRSKLVHLTPKGKKLVERAVAEVMRVESQWIEQALSAKELEQLKKLLGKTAKAVESVPNRLE